MEFYSKRWQKLAGVLTESHLYESAWEVDEYGNEYKDMEGEKCTDCDKGTYRYLSFQDENSGNLTCPECYGGVDAYQYKNKDRKLEIDALERKIAKHEKAVKKLEGSLDFMEKEEIPVPEDVRKSIFILNRQVHKLNKKLSSYKLQENISPEAAQDTSAYFGSNDSVDGPYAKKTKKQPLKFDKSANLSEVKDKYPETAEDYAKQLNTGKDNYKLVEDPEYWEERNIFTGEELARHLAESSFINVYKEFFGIKPPASLYKGLSPEQIEEAIDEIMNEFSSDELE